MAELHIIGQLLSARGFSDQNIFCKWNLQYGNNWKVVSGREDGQTQVESTEYGDEHPWGHPIDVHLATCGARGWPKLYVRVFRLDWLGRVHLLGYGFVNVPSAPGSHRLDCFTWRPLGRLRDRLVQFFVGGGIQLDDPDMLCNPGDRFKLNTETMGTVTFEIGIVLRNFSKFGVEYK